MKPQAKLNVSFTFILPTFVHKTSDFPSYRNLGWGSQIFQFKIKHKFSACFGLLTAQVFSKHTKHIESSNIYMPGLFIT